MSHTITACIVFAAITIAGIFTTVKQWRALYISGKAEASRRAALLKFIGSLMLLLFGSGCFLFLQAFIYENDKDGFVFNWVEYLLRPMMSSFDMFMLDIDSDILHEIGTHDTLKGLLMINAALSFACTLSLIAGLLATRVKAYFKLRLKVGRNTEEYCIFFGVNTDTELLAADIRKNRPGAAIILVETIETVEDDSGIDSIVKSVTQRSSIFRFAKSIGADVALADAPAHTVEGNKILKGMNLICLDKILKKASPSATVNIFLLSHDDNNNAAALAALAGDATLRSLPGIHFFCRGAAGTMTLGEELSRFNGLDIRMVDMPRLAVESLKANGEMHPVRFIETEPGRIGTDKTFTALVVGFGSTGQRALEFLYQFSALPDSRTLSGDVRRSPVNITIADSAMSIIKGRYLSARPVIADIASGKDPGRPEHLSFIKADCRSRSFFERVLTPAFCLNANYIVVSIADDDTAMSVAVDILDRIRTFRQDLSKLVIAVHCTDGGRYHSMHTVAHNYNCACGYNTIRIFGNPESLLTYEAVVKARTERDASVFCRRYSLLTPYPTDWMARRKECYNNIAENKGTAIDIIRNLMRMERQDRINVRHISTKLDLLHRALPNIDPADLARRVFPDKKIARTGSYDNISYPNLSEKENAVMRGLAITEHLRWNASHEMLGYRRGDINNHRERTHKCLTHWQNLSSGPLKNSDDYKLFDYNVVETSLYLSYIDHE